MKGFQAIRTGQIYFGSGSTELALFLKELVIFVLKGVLEAMSSCFGLGILC